MHSPDGLGLTLDKQKSASIVLLAGGGLQREGFDSYLLNFLLYPAR
jgi:hypothetical protein